jgi:1-deoxy-D-xylulose-5-phosphate synthase
LASRWQVPDDGSAVAWAFGPPRAGNDRLRWEHMLLDDIQEPSDLRALSQNQLAQLASEIRQCIVETVTTNGGHLGSDLGVVELTLALHRVFDSPTDAIIWDTGHQAYPHKLITGRRGEFKTLRQAGGLSGYPSRSESEHDWVENSHASTALSYAHGLATGFGLRGEKDRRVVAVVGDGALTGGMAYEALNNLGHSRCPVIIILNDNGRSYAPTVSRLSQGLTYLRLNPSYVQARERVRRVLRGLPGLGGLAYSSMHGLTSAVREIVTPHTFFETLGVRYAGPIDGHDLAGMEQAFSNAAEWRGPIVLHVLTQKGHGYAPAEEDEVQRLHDFKVESPSRINGDPAPVSYTDTFTQALIDQAARRSEVVAITAAMPGPTGLLPFQDAFPERFFDVGIAEQHAVTAAAGMAMAGLRPVVAVYSTFFSRAFDQANLDVGLHELPVVFAMQSAGITGPNGPSHHGVLDLAQCLSIPGMTVMAPSCASDVEEMLDAALSLEGPSVIRFPNTPGRRLREEFSAEGLSARQVRRGEGGVCMLAVGKMVEAAEEAAAKLAADGVDATVWDVRVIAPPDPQMLDDAARHDLVVTIEDGVRVGGAGAFLVDAMRRCARESGKGEAGRCAVRLLGIPRSYVPHGKPDQILSDLGLDGQGIAASVTKALCSIPGEGEHLASEG